MIWEDIELVASDEHYCAAVWRNVVVTVWHKETMVESVQCVERAVVGLQGAFPKGVAVLMVVEKKASLPSDAARVEIAGMIRRIDRRLVGCGYVFEGEGFASAAVRYVIIGLTMLGRPSYDYTIVKSVPEVASWLSTRLIRTDSSASPEEIGSAVARIRSIGSHPMIDEQARAHG